MRQIVSGRTMTISGIQREASPWISMHRTLRQTMSNIHMGMDYVGDPKLAKPTDTANEYAYVDYNKTDVCDTMHALRSKATT